MAGDALVYFLGTGGFQTVIPVSAANPLPTTANFSGSVTATTAQTANAAAPTYTEGSATNPLSCDLNGFLRVLAKQSGTWTNTVTQATAANLNATVTFAANQSVEVTNLPTTVDTNSGNASASTPRSVLATNSPAIANWGQGATGSAVPSGAELQGLLAKTTNPSAASDGNLTAAMSDKLGRQVVVIGNVRDLKGNQYTALSSASEATVVSAVASTFLDVYGVIAANTTGAAVTLVFKDSTGGSTQFELQVPAGDTRGFMLPSSDAYKQTTVNNNWTCTGGASGVNISVLFVKNI